jgi:virulence-associated protein VagC
MDIRLDKHIGMPTETTVFQTGNRLAVRLLGDCRLPRGTKVRERRGGKRIVMEAVDEWPSEFLVLAGSWKEKIVRPKWGKIRDPFA